eukprot:TRINITY_DN13789_c0_g1_i1.p1 TRINITY_DN13789_c0_g1~~TRINITY_DN13789_c0_g1_i1.p1  ORF type:complete len:275 (-),score=113.43 TRINITY_DN13789_c0_g1_i1:49-873(-)
MATEQWNLKVKIAEMDNAAMQSGKKNKWEKGDVLTVSIEPHATVNMLKQRIALIVLAHPKHQSIALQDGDPLDDIVKLEAVEGLSNGSTIMVSIAVPPEPEAPPVVISDDEGLVTAEEEAAPEMPSKEVIGKELDDAAMDKKGELKSQAQDAIEDGDTKGALAKFTEALLLGNISAMEMAKRAEMLLKLKRYCAAIADADVALELNPDSAKAYRVRGKARRFLGQYEGAGDDLSQAQKIDYDDGVADMHKYVQTRLDKMKQKAKQDAKAAEKSA